MSSDTLTWYGPRVILFYFLLYTDTMGKEQMRPRMSQAEYELFKKFREQHAALITECEANGLPAGEVSQYWFKSENFSIQVKPSTKTYFDIKDELIAELKEYAPKYPKISYPKIKDGHLLVIDPADVHIGKLSVSFETGEDYDNQIAVQRVRDGVNGILQKTKGFNIDQILLVIGNDILHIDTPRRTTTSGTPQDTDGMWYEAFQLAKSIYVEVIEALMQIAPVHVQYDPSNHDYTNGFFLADTLASWFANCKSVTFNCSIAHRKYYTYGTNLIGTTHGDGAKDQDLPLLMAHEAKEWSDSKHRYFYTHHIHHKKSRDYMGVCVESLRSPSGTDSWHHRNGFTHTPKAIEGFVHHKTNGQIARITHIF